MTAQVTFRRGGGWMDRWRAYRIMVNDHEVARLKRNRHVSVDLPAGRHVITAEIDWCGGNVLTVDLADGDDIEVDVTNRHGVWRSQRVITQAPGTYLTLTITLRRKAGAVKLNARLLDHDQATDKKRKEGFHLSAPADPTVRSRFDLDSP